MTEALLQMQPKAMLRAYVLENIKEFAFHVCRPPRGLTPKDPLRSSAWASRAQGAYSDIGSGFASRQRWGWQELPTYCPDELEGYKG